MQGNQDIEVVKSNDAGVLGRVPEFRSRFDVCAEDRRWGLSNDSQ